MERAGSFTFAGCRLMLFLGGPPDLGPGAVGVVSPGLAGGGDADGEGDRFVHDQLFRGEVRWGGESSRGREREAVAFGPWRGLKGRGKRFSVVCLLFASGGRVFGRSAYDLVWPSYGTAR